MICLLLTTIQTNSYSLLNTSTKLKYEQTTVRFYPLATIQANNLPPKKIMIESPPVRPNPDPSPSPDPNPQPSPTPEPQPVPAPIPQPVPTPIPQPVPTPDPQPIPQPL